MAESRLLSAPRHIFTDAYLNDPIEFNDERGFSPESAVRLLASESTVARDSDGALRINTNARSSQHYVVSMLRTVYLRRDFNRIIDIRFRQLART